MTEETTASDPRTFALVDKIEELKSKPEPPAYTDLMAKLDYCEEKISE